MTLTINKDLKKFEEWWEDMEPIRVDYSLTEERIAKHWAQKSWYQVTDMINGVLDGIEERTDR